MHGLRVQHTFALWWAIRRSLRFIVTIVETADDIRQSRTPESHREHKGQDGPAHPLYRSPAGELKPGDTIAEATSGNTGISFAALGDAFGNKVRIFMPDWMSQERIALIRSYGAEIRLVSREEGGFKGSIALL